MNSRPRKRQFLLIIIYSIASLFIISLVRYPGIVNRLAGIISAVEFEGYTPYQYRVFMPILIKTAEYITPAVIKDTVNQQMSGYLDTEFRYYRNDVAGVKVDRLSQYGYRIVLYIGFIYLMLIIFLFLLREFSRSLKIFSETACDLIPLGMVLVLPTYFCYTLMQYDYPHLLLFTFGFYLMYKEKWLPFILVYILGCFNKETMSFLTIIFSVYFFTRMQKPKFLKLLFLQIGIALTIKSLLYVAFKDNPGGLAVWTIERNLRHLSLLSNYFNFDTIKKGMFFPIYLAIPLPRGINIPMLILVIFFAGYGWNRKPIFLRRSTYYFPLLIIMAFIWGFVDEFRAYYDALPIVYFLGLSGLKFFIEDYKTKRVRAYING